MSSVGPTLAGIRFNTPPPAHLDDRAPYARRYLIADYVPVVQRQFHGTTASPVLLMTFRARFLSVPCFHDRTWTRRLIVRDGILNRAVIGLTDAVSRAGFLVVWLSSWCLVFGITFVVFVGEFAFKVVPWLLALTCACFLYLAVSVYDGVYWVLFAVLSATIKGAMGVIKGVHSLFL